MDGAPPRRDRALIAVIAAVAAIAVIALAVVLTRGAAEPLDGSTPAGVVQRYAEAVIAGDEDAARELLVAEVRDDCERVEPGVFDEVRVSLTGTTERESSADVDVTIVTASGGGLLGTSEYREEATFDLVRTGSGWEIETAPWQFAVCAEATR